MKTENIDAAIKDKQENITHLKSQIIKLEKKLECLREELRLLFLEKYKLDYKKGKCYKRGCVYYRINHFDKVFPYLNCDEIIYRKGEIIEMHKSVLVDIEDLGEEIEPEVWDEMLKKIEDL